MMFRGFITFLTALVLSVALVGCATNGDVPNSNSSGLNIFSFLSSSTIWERMSDDYFLINQPYPKAVQEQLAWMKAHKRYIKQLARNASPYIYYVYHQTRVRGLPAELALLPMIESAYDPFGYSRAGATGLWQLMPGTGYGFGLKIDWWYDARRDVVASTNAALDYLTYLYKFFDHNWLLAIAAYDSGEGTVQAALDFNRRHHRSTSFWNLPLPEETKSYVPKLLALSIIFGDPSEYGIQLPAVPDQPYFGEVDMDYQIDVRLAAKLADTTPDVVRQLNPGFRRWATTPDNSYQLLLPLDKVKIFKKRLAELPKGDRVKWRHHRVASGQTLNGIAEKYHTTVDIIKQVNGLKSNTIFPKQTLLVPLSAHGKFGRLNANRAGKNIAEDKLPGPKKHVHTVTSHDTLNKIARRYGVKVSQITFWNNLDYRSKIQPGEKLVIWLPPHSYDTTVYDKYKVRHGDSLNQIAKRFNMTVDHLKSVNKLKSNLIRVGQVLKIPHRTYRQFHYKNEMLVHHVQSGDSLNKIAHDNHVSVHELEKWNHLHDNSILHPGQRIVMYKRIKV